MLHEMEEKKWEMRGRKKSKDKQYNFMDMEKVKLQRQAILLKKFSNPENVLVNDQ